MTFPIRQATFYDRRNLKTLPRLDKPRLLADMWSEWRICLEAKVKTRVSRPKAVVGFLLKSMFYSHKYSVKLYSCILFNYVFKFPRRTKIKNNWKWAPEYAFCAIWKRMCSCCLSQSTLSLVVTFHVSKKQSSVSWSAVAITVLFLLHWRGYNYEGIKYFFYFSEIPRSRFRISL